MPKVKGLTLKQRKFRKELIKTLSPTEAAMRIYDCKDRKVAAVIACENLIKLNISMVDLMNQMGLTDEQDIEDLKKLRKATKQISCNIYIKKDGEMKGADGKSFDFIEVDDNPTQLKALELTFKLKGRLRDKTVDIKNIITNKVDINGSLTDEERRKQTEQFARYLPSLLGDREV